MDGVIKEWKARVIDTEVSLKGSEDLSVIVLLFADDAVLLAEDESALQKLVREICRACDRRKLNINIDKSKVVVASKEGGKANMDIGLNNLGLEKVESFSYNLDL